MERDDLELKKTQNKVYQWHLKLSRISFWETQDYGTER
jgi:hypothetical protein